MSTSPVPSPRSPRFGAHMAIAGGLHKAIHSGREVGCEVIQVFTKSPQQWKAKEITDEQAQAFLDAQAETGIHCLAAHDTYLINPAAIDPEMLQKSREALADELVRANLLKIPYLVMHQGSQGAASLDDALGRLSDSVKYALDHSVNEGTVLLLETTAGQGKCLGAQFEEVARVLDAVNGGERLGVCLDTCHIFAAGYDIRTPEGYAEVMEQFDRMIGLHRVRIIHANDSKKELGSRVDRHEAIGQGCIGPEAFRLLLTDPRLAHVPAILETPKEGDMDPINLAAIRRAAGCEPAVSVEE